MRKIEVQLTEYIATLLPHGINLEGSSTSAPPDAVAGALGLSKLSRGAELIVRVKHMYEKQFTCDLWGEGFKRVWSAHHKKAWGNSASDLPMITKVAMQEAIEDRIICQSCGGHKFIMIDDKPIECMVCGGKGFTPFNRNEIAKRAGINPKNTGNWSAPYAYALRVFREFELEVEKGLAKHFLGDFYA